MYKAVIALNNTGVSLLDHGFYHGAIETLKDSMRLMKGLVRMKDEWESRSEPTSPSIRIMSTDTANRIECDTALQAACRRKSMIHHRLDGVNMNQNVLVISEHDHPCKVHDHLVQHPSKVQLSSTAFLYCVTIDLLPMDDDDTLHRLQQESALILYNLSIAYRCLAKEPNTSISLSTMFDYHRISFQLMEYAYSALCSVFQTISECEDLIMNISLKMFSICMLILHNLREMSLENNFLRDKHVQYNEAYEHIVMGMTERFMHTAEEEIQKFLGAAAA